MIKTFKKYIFLLVSFFQASLISELEFRFNIAARFVTDILWYAAQLSVFQVLFHHTRSLNGWSLLETRVFMGCLFVTDAVYMMLFSENLDKLGTKIRKGDLDLLLVKPVNSQWMLSFQKVSIAYAGNLTFALGWLAWSAAQIENFAWMKMGWMILAVPVGLSIVYSIRFMTAATALFFTRADAVTYIWYQLYRLGTRPDNFYPTALRFAVLAVIPVGFLASIPAQIILGKEGPEWLIWGALLAALLICLSSVVWNRGLRAYSSTGS